MNLFETPASYAEDNTLPPHEVPPEPPESPIESIAASPPPGEAQEASWRSVVRKAMVKAGAIATAAVLGSSALMVGGEVPSEPPVPATTSAAFPLAPSPANIHRAEELLNTPNPVNIGNIQDHIFNSPDGTVTPLQNRQADYQVHKAEADHYGLTVRDATPYILNLEEDLNNGHEPRLPFSTYFARAQAFMAEYGIDLHLYTPSDYVDDEVGYGERALTKAELSAPCDTVSRLNCARRDVVNLMADIATLPQEYIDLIDLKHIVYATGSKTAAAFAGGDMIHFELGEIGGGVVYHEAGHLLAQTENAGGNNDPVLTSWVRDDGKAVTVYDRGVPYGHKAIDADHTYGAFTHARQRLYRKREVKFQRGNLSAACAVDHQIDDLGKKVVFSDTYGAKNAAEEFAQMTANLEEPNTVVSGVEGDYFSPQLPNLRAQALGNLARLGALDNWRLASYFVMVNQLNYPRITDPACLALSQQMSLNFPTFLQSTK